MQEGRDKFRVGIQSYSLRTFPYERMLRTVKELGLKYVEVFPGHLPPTEEQEKQAAIREQLRQMGLDLFAYGVVPFGRDAAANRRLFAFAQAVGIKVLSADPAPDSFPSLVELVKEFGVKVAIHNHGPRHRYGTKASLLRALENLPPDIGVCLDTGHLVRAGDEVVATIRALRGRIHGVHLKDVNEDKHDVVLGSGILDLPAILHALREAGFQGCLALEHELNPRDPLPGIRQALTHLRKVLAELE
jgi:sugar phosphate isomerase/epimerase